MSPGCLASRAFAWWRICLLVGILGVCAGPVQATITLTINTSAKTFSFSGSASGTPLVFGEIMVIAWENAYYNSSDFVSFLNNALTTSSGTIQIPAYYQSSTYTSFLFVPSSTSHQTLTGNSNVSFSYSSLTAGEIASFESLSSLPLQSGSGFGAMAVETIPEPTTWALLAMGAAVFLFRRRALRS